MKHRYRTSALRGLSFPAFERAFPDEQSCTDYLFWLRDGANLICSRCGTPSAWRSVPNTKTFAASCCKKTLSVAQGSILASTNLPLWTWFYTFLLVLNLGPNMSAAFLARHLGVGNITAWRMLFRMRCQISEICKAALPSLEGRELYLSHCYIRNVKTDGPRGTGKLNVLIVSDGTNVFAFKLEARKLWAYVPVIRRFDGFAGLFTSELSAYRIISGRQWMKASLLPLETHTYPANLRLASDQAASFRVYMLRSFRKRITPVSRTHVQGYIDDLVFRFNFAQDKALLFPLFMSSFARLGR